MDGAKLDVVGEIHTMVTRDKLQLKFSALVVRNMATEALAGTGFYIENDVYSRMANDKIVIQGKYYFNLTPTIALIASIHSYYSEVAKTMLPKAFTYPLLVKADKSATILPGEGFHVPICSIHEDDAVEIEPRKEAPDGFIHNHVKEIDKDIVFIQNMASEPITIKKNTPLCQLRETKPVLEKMKEKREKVKEKGKWQGQ